MSLKPKDKDESTQSGRKIESKPTTKYMVQLVEDRVQENTSSIFKHLSSGSESTEKWMHTTTALPAEEKQLRKWSPPKSKEGDLGLKYI